MGTENAISKAKNVLVVLSQEEDKPNDLRYLIENFCGTVVHDFLQIQGEASQKRIYVCGDVGKAIHYKMPLYIIRELAYGYENRQEENWQLVTLGQVPIIVANAGVFFRRFFEEDDYFHQIKEAHAFQDLTESTKPSQALRKGIYLTEVAKELTADENEILHYRLLRCSSNFSGATDNFRAIDHTIMKAMNEAAQYVFEQAITLNHVLAQIYENKKNPENEAKETKAKIKAHSDKTKDMPSNALIAFCTFYDTAHFQSLQPSAKDKYDWCYKDRSGLTKLHFKLKNSDAYPTLEKEFSVTLYPNSIFFIPLSTNRLYTHEIRPSILNIDKIPTRMGYVARCSNMEAVFMNEQTYIKENGELIKLAPMTEETLNDLRNFYVEENKNTNRIEYGKVHFSMNLGDYQKPIY